MEQTTRVYFPKWSIRLYAVMAIILTPWIFDLAASLPSNHSEQHWDALWVGFDVIMLVSIFATIWFLVKRMVWVVVSATALATLLLVDVWFDVLTAKPGHEQHKAVLFGVLEVTLSLLTYRLVYLVIHHSTPSKSFTLHIKGKKSS